LTQPTVARLEPIPMKAPVDVGVDRHGNGPVERVWSCNCGLRLLPLGAVGWVTEMTSGDLWGMR
jgi:hypothetical protein